MDLTSLPASTIPASYLSRIKKFLKAFLFWAITVLFSSFFILD